eukprot:1619554-Amphidinium_carterae.1
MLVCSPGGAFSVLACPLRPSDSQMCDCHCTGGCASRARQHANSTEIPMKLLPLPLPLKAAASSQGPAPTPGPLVMKYFEPMSARASASWDVKEKLQCAYDRLWRSMELLVRLCQFGQVMATLVTRPWLPNPGFPLSTLS